MIALAFAVHIRGARGLRPVNGGQVRSCDCPRPYISIILQYLCSVYPGSLSSPLTAHRGQSCSVLAALSCITVFGDSESEWSPNKGRRRGEVLSVYLICSFNNKHIHSFAVDNNQHLQFLYVVCVYHEPVNFCILTFF